MITALRRVLQQRCVCWHFLFTTGRGVLRWPSCLSRLCPLSLLGRYSSTTAFLQLERLLAFQYVWDLHYYVKFGGGENGQTDNSEILSSSAMTGEASVNSCSLINQRALSRRLSFVHS